MMNDTAQLRIIEAAGPIFAHKGFSGTTVREICAAAKVNQAAINYYFGSKENLYKEVFTSTYSSMTPWNQLIDNPPEQPSASFEERFRQIIIRRTREIYATELASWKIQLIFRELHNPTSSCGEKLQEYIVRDYMVLYHFLDEEYFDPQVPEDIRWKSIFSIFGTVFFYKSSGWVLRKIVSDDMRKQAFQPKDIADFAVDGFLAFAAPLRRKNS